MMIFKTTISRADEAEQVFSLFVARSFISVRRHDLEKTTIIIQAGLRKASGAAISSFLSLQDHHHCVSRSAMILQPTINHSHFFSSSCIVRTFVSRKTLHELRDSGTHRNTYLQFSTLVRPSSFFYRTSCIGANERDHKRAMHAGKT
jgi:hypothetical protein